MARSLGDGVAAQVGVIAEPGKYIYCRNVLIDGLEILQFDLEEEDKFMVIASDGVWEFLSNEQVLDYIVSILSKK